VVTNSSSYDKLAEKIGAGGYPSYIRLLENQLTAEEAQTLVDMEEGVSEENLAKKLKLDQKALAAKIEDLVKRRVILRGKGGYKIPRSPRFFPQGPNDEKTRQLRTDFFRCGDYQKILVEGWKVRLQNGGLQSHKVIPAHQALVASPNLDKNYILWYEDMNAIFNRAEKRWQGGFKEDGSLGSRQEGGCGCRSVWIDACDYHGGCTGWEWKTGEWGNDETAKNEQTRPFRPGHREITIEEALKACHQMEDAGQIHISPNTAQITSTCNCCPCCCVIMQPMKNYGNIYEMLAPSRYRAVVDEEKCTGCQTCVERCHFDAVEMKKVPGSKKMKSFIINEHCMGCGLCVFKCPSQAIRLELVRPPAHIPTTPWMSPSTFAGTAGRAAKT
jgi:Pyruvate/2-oxoacid:ferredoxin oxidoreductase delta subunit